MQRESWYLKTYRCVQGGGGVASQGFYCLHTLWMGPFRYYQSLLYYEKFLKSREKEKHYALTFHKNFKNSKPRVQFYWILQKKCIIFITISAWCQSFEYFSVMVSGNDCKYCNVTESYKTVFQKGFKIILPYYAKHDSRVTSELL